METRFFDKNTTYTVIDITKAVISATDRYKDFDSARCAVSQKIKDLGISSVNGQKRNRYFTGLDAQRVFEEITGRKQLSLLPQISDKPEEPKMPKTKPVFLNFTTKRQGVVSINIEEIGTYSIPSLWYHITLRGGGTLITLRNNKKIHVEEIPQEVEKMIKNAVEE